MSEPRHAILAVVIGATVAFGQIPTPPVKPGGTVPGGVFPSGPRGGRPAKSPFGTRIPGKPGGVSPLVPNGRFGAKPASGNRGQSSIGTNRSPFGTSQGNPQAGGASPNASPFGGSTSGASEPGNVGGGTNPFTTTVTPGMKTNSIARTKRVKYAWRVGVILEATTGPGGRLWGTAAVPSDWPEQTVKIIKREVTPHVRNFRIRKLKDGVEQMYFEVPRLARGEKATALLTYEIEKQPVPLPESPETLLIPTRPPRDVAVFLGASPGIESRHNSLRSKAKSLTRDVPLAWEKANAIYKFVRNEIEFREGELQGAVATLREGYGQKEDLISLFIGLCRATRIPARTVWIPNHCYAEFYLEDKDGKGHWLPCELVGEPYFGEMPDVRPILQRGEKFAVPEKKAPQRYVAEILKGKAGAGLFPPTHSFMRELTTIGF